MTEVVRAGWLQKRSSFLKRWKKKWFSLSMDGYLRVFETPDQPVAKMTIHVPTEVIAVKAGPQVEGATPPEGQLTDSLLQIITRKNEDSWYLCAESQDEMLAWQLALEQARVIHNAQARSHIPPNVTNDPSTWPPYIQEVYYNNPNNGYPMVYRGGSAYRGQYPTRIVHTPQGPVTVVYVNDYYYDYPRYGYGGCGYGLAGAALATSLFFPFWFPFFLWC